MSLKNQLLYEKYRPKKMEDLILPERIKKQFEKGVSKNFIFYGTYGIGKTSLARILIGKYTKDKPYIEINSSLHTSIDTLRDQIDKFCKTVPMMESDNGDDLKYVFLDEFEKVSPSYQEAFKAFVEHYHENVRFILSTNHMSKITEAIKKSRFTSINFDCQSKEEEKLLKTTLYHKIMTDVGPNEGLKLDRDVVISIINKRFPDLRSVYNDIQDIIDLGTPSTEGVVNNSNRNDLYDIIYDKSADYEKIYHFLMSSFGQDKIDQLFQFLGRDFIQQSLKNNKDVDKLFQLNYIISDYRASLNTDTDPIILGMTVIGKFRDILIWDLLQKTTKHP